MVETFYCAPGDEYNPPKWFHDPNRCMAQHGEVVEILVEFKVTTVRHYDAEGDRGR